MFGILCVPLRLCGKRTGKTYKPQRRRRNDADGPDPVTDGRKTETPTELVTQMMPGVVPGSVTVQLSVGLSNVMTVVPFGRSAQAWNFPSATRSQRSCLRIEGGRSTQDAGCTIRSNASFCSHISTYACALFNSIRLITTNP